MDINGQSAIISGAASGLGEATAKHLASQGCKIGIIDINEDAVKSLAEKTGGAWAVCDISNAEATEEAFEQLQKKIGLIRVLVACAGVATGSKLVSRDGTPNSLDKFRRVIEINLIGTINCMRLAAASISSLDPVAEGERGVMIGTASAAAFEGQIGQCAYSASKGGVASMTLTLARELARDGIRVNTIAPGLMDTPMTSGLPDPVRESLIAKTLYPKRLGQSEEYAQLVEHICKNKFINGSVIRFDGALRLEPK